MKIRLVASLFLLSGCDDYPRDIAGTLDHIRAEKVIRVGLIAGDAQVRDRVPIAAYLKRVATATGARPVLIDGAAEPLLVRLQEGELDLVIGELSKDTPWKTEVMVIDPISRRPLGTSQVTLSPVARNGENAWIMLLEREARNMGAGA